MDLANLLPQRLAHRWRAGNLGCLVVMAMIWQGFANASVQDLSRRPLEHKDYDVWNTMSSEQISRDGKWIAYTVQNGSIDGEATLYLHNTANSREYIIERGSGAQWTCDSRFAVYRVTPEKRKLKELRQSKTKSEDLPKSQLQILELESGQIITLDRVRSFKVPEESGDWVACHLEAPRQTNSIDDKKSSARESYLVTPNGLRRPEKPLKLKSRAALALERGETNASPIEKQTSKERKTEKEKEKSKDDNSEKEDQKDKTEGTPLVLINVNTGMQRLYPSVDSYLFSRNGEALAFSTSVELNAQKDRSETNDNGSDTKRASVDQPADGVHIIELKSLKRHTIAQGTGKYKNIAFNEKGSNLAFITNRDDYQTKTPAWSVFLWTSNSKVAKKVATEGDKGIDAGWWIATDSSQRFSEDGLRLYFDTAPVPDDVVEQRIADAEDRKVEKEEDNEQAKLDIWHWQDPQLQPQQLLEAERERKRDYRAAFILKSKKIVQLATKQIPSVNLDYKSSAIQAVANTNRKYRKLLSWESPGFQDAWIVNLNTGKRRLILEKVRWNVSMSPEGRYITWFDAATKKWFAKATNQVDAVPIEISKGIKFPLYNELHDRPSLPRSYGNAGWTVDDKAILVYDRYDIWQLDPLGKTKPVCITNGWGRKNNLQFRYRQLDSEERAIDPNQPMMLSAFDQKTKASGYYKLILNSDQKTNQGKLDQKNPRSESSLEKLIMLNEALGGLKKADDSDDIIFTRSSFERCPDLWRSDLSFKKIHRVSEMNPQQHEYKWGTAELVHWKASDGQDLDGILMKPDDFDPSKKYPMMVYFYERNSDNLHRYYTPAAGRSIICHSFYVSRDYLVFIPDIPYTTGEPGPSAANAIIPGVNHLIKQGFVDKTKIGMQGHSWGGYQAAYLVTQTDLFTCAEAGAPVSNMTSAYGGIRWGSGMSRMFQYERTQSRIGEDLWSARQKYIANSPLFFADQINTPLLILHNDEDGAVPWYQGIELFVALRRLEKPSWMLNYNGNPHWVMGDYNRRDFAIRLQQFFDHYLMNAPEPEWMAVGVSAVDKGENLGLDLLEPVKSAPEQSHPAVKTQQ